MINEIHKDDIGVWCGGKVNDGSPEKTIQLPYVHYSDAVMQFIEEVYNFHNEHPEFELNRYGDILHSNNINLIDDGNLDVSDMNGQVVMAILTAAVRSERFCDGVIKHCFDGGLIDKWLLRLKEIDDYVNK
ncbi:MAG: DUF6508 domain-containing protein [Saccharofermentans sp.]|nr:DUF6508 domain-containing protein [Saccharofermentans sp.]